ncbi:MAG TPA: S41 family peptidase [Prosthecobacter sp.]|nr:S41 family peptidase [Prosthecobacter sp.]
MKRLCLILAMIGCAGPAVAEAPPKKLENISQAAVQSAFQVLRSEYIRNGELTYEELNRAALQGLLQRLHLGAELIDKEGAKLPVLPTGVLSEMLTDEIAYLRPLSYAENEIPALEKALADYHARKVPHLILDLRTPAAPGEFRIAASLLDLFMPRGQMLFRLKQVAKEDSELFISNREPTWPGNLVVLADEETNNLGETIAAVLKQSGRAIIMGSQTRGASVRYETVPLDDRWLLRFAHAEMLLSDGTSLFGNGLKPDFQVMLPVAVKRQIFAIPDGVTSVRDMIFDRARPRYNEAALVARKNPELELYIRQSQSNQTDDATEPPKDTVLQRAVDMINARGHLHAFKMQWSASQSGGKPTVRKAEPATEP